MRIALISVLIGSSLTASSVAAQASSVILQSDLQTSLLAELHDIGGSHFGSSIPARFADAPGTAVQRALHRTIDSDNTDDSMWGRVGVGALIGAAVGAGAALYAVSKMEDPIIDPRWVIGVPALVGAVIGGAIAAPVYEPDEQQDE